MNKRAILHDDDIVVHTESQAFDVHRALVALWPRIKAMVQSKEPEWIDADGEVHTRRWRFVFGEHHEDLTIRQRAFLHTAVFPQIADQYTFPDGTRFGDKAWKEHFRDRFLGYRWEMRRAMNWDAALAAMVQAKRATPHRVRISTEDLNVRQYSQYIDKVIDTAVLELGIVFEFRPSEREGARWRKPVRKPKSEPVALPAAQAEKEAACSA